MERGTKRKMIPLRLTDQEREVITSKMNQAGISKIAVYVRKMALDGYVLTLDMPELREMISLLRYSSNNLNQIAKRANETGRVYDNDLHDIQAMQEKIWLGINQILSRLEKLH